MIHTLKYCSWNDWPDMSLLASSPCSDPRFSLTGSRESSCSDHYGWISHRKWRRWFQKRTNDCLDPRALQTLKQKRRKGTVSQRPPSYYEAVWWPNVFQKKREQRLQNIRQNLYIHISYVQGFLSFTICSALVAHSSPVISVVCADVKQGKTSSHDKLCSNYIIIM